MTAISSKVLIDMIKKEIEWCKANPPTAYGLSTEYGHGFVAGLEQSLYIITLIHDKKVHQTVVIKDTRKDKTK